MAVYQTTTLPNGVTVATAAMPHMRSVCVGLWVGVGGRHEPAEVSGISHFIEHMLFKGTTSRTAEQISQSVEGLGGYLNAFTSEDHTCFYARVVADRRDDVLEVLFDMLLRSKFSEEDIAKERNVIREELAMYRDQPQQYVHELLNQLQWPDQPLGRPLAGTDASLKRIRRPQFLAHLDRCYVTEATLVCAAGAVDHAALVESVKRLSRHCRRGPKPEFTPALNPRTRPAIRLDTRKTSQAQLALGIRTTSRHDPRRYALRVLNAIVGETMSSRLFVELRENLGLAYDINSSLSFFEDTGDLVVSAGLDSANVEKALKLILRELRGLAAKPVGTAELRRAKDYIVGQMELGLESTENHMMTLGEQLLGWGRITAPEEVGQRLRAVRPSEVRRAMEDFLRPERLSLALVSPRKDGARLEALLGKIPR